jgi:3-methyl-2-oxobutanoate hydroxymethyltransferase
MKKNKVTLSTLKKAKKDKCKITMLTAYDYPQGMLVDKSGIDIVLVGDSLGNTVLGYESTVPVTMDEMLHHSKAVRRAIKKSFLIGDMPFMSYNNTRKEAIRNAGRFLKEAGCDAVKLEGGIEVANTIKSIVNAGIPVLGHLGLTPQTVSKLGGYKVQGRSAKKAQEMIESALALEKAGCFGIVLECIPWQLAKIITQKLKIFTIGIGAGAHCDGQVLVLYDLLGASFGHRPSFAKQYTDVASIVTKAIKNYKIDVKTGKFPSKKQSFSMKTDELKKLS